MPKTHSHRQAKTTRTPVQPTSAKNKRLTTVETAQSLLLPILMHDVSGKPATFTEAAQRLYAEDLQLYYQLNEILGPLLDNTEDYHYGLEVSGTPHPITWTAE